jgi:hypothetical protein
MKDGCMRAPNLSTILHAMDLSGVNTTRREVKLNRHEENATRRKVDLTRREENPTQYGKNVT